MQIEVTRLDKKIVFRFLPQPTGISVLIVANAKEEILWRLSPVQMQPINALNAQLTSIPPVPDEQITPLIPFELGNYRPLEEVIYGEVPDGYKERQGASPLEPGEKYCVTCFGEGLDHSGAFFLA